MSLPGSEHAQYPVAEATYFVSQEGNGRPVLLLHEFPETHACWGRVAPRLAESSLRPSAGKARLVSTGLPVVATRSAAGHFRPYMPDASAGDYAASSGAG